MAKNIDSELKSIGMYLPADGKGVFIIHEYQRAYFWTISQCDKLWEDIIYYIESQGEGRYFFGTIIVNMQNNDKSFLLIDGQQRTTTFFIAWSYDDKASRSNK